MFGVVLTALAGILIGLTAGLQMRRARMNVSPESAIALFPRLSALSALITGVVLATGLLILAIRQWTSLAALITGPLLALYGFVSFFDSLTAYRQSAPAQTLQRAIPPASSLAEVGLGIQMGLLLCAAGVRDVVFLAPALLAAFIASTGVFPERARFIAVAPWSEIARCAAGAMLCAAGVGALIERMSEHTIRAEPVTVILVVGLWAAAATAFCRAPRSMP